MRWTSKGRYVSPPTPSQFNFPLMAVATPYVENVQSLFYFALALRGHASALYQ